MRILVLSLSLLILLTSCRSAETPLSWYVLSAPPVDASSLRTPSDTGPEVLIERIELAEFLRQSGLVLQTGPQQLQVSNQHLWAQGLDEALPRLLLQELQQQAPDYRFYLATDYVPMPAYRMRLQIDSFHALESGEALCAGRFQLIDAATGNSRVRNFRFTAALQQDGHAHAVEQLAGLTRELAKMLAQELGAQTAP